MSDATFNARINDDAHGLHKAVVDEILSRPPYNSAIFRNAFYGARKAGADLLIYGETIHVRRFYTTFLGLRTGWVLQRGVVTSEETTIPVWGDRVPEVELEHLIKGGGDVIMVYDLKKPFVRAVTDRKNLPVPVQDAIRAISFERLRSELPLWQRALLTVSPERRAEMKQKCW